MDQTSFLKFYCGTNLVDTGLAPGFPWEFAPLAESLEAMRVMPKTKRRSYVKTSECDWHVYTPIRAAIPSGLVGKENPPVALRGLVTDFDATISLEEIRKVLAERPAEFQPNFIEITLSKHFRLVWLFEEELLVPDTGFCSELFKLLFKKLGGVANWFAGYDANSEKPSQRWTNGAEWHALNPTPLSKDFVIGVAIDASKKWGDEAGDVPLDQVAERVQELYSNRWQGEFKLNALGVRFWDEKADNETGCQVKPDGMLCFTGKEPFVKWAKILGPEWVNTRRAVHLATIAQDIHFDGRGYWQHRGQIYVPKSREDVLLELRHNGVSGTKGKGQTVSDAERVLNYIQNQNRVAGAAPLVNYPPGIQHFDNERVLNIANCRALEPASEKHVVPEVHFPWTWNFLNGLFVRSATGLQPLEHFLAWLARFYRSQREYKRLMGQAVFLCGPVNNGKTLLCMHIVKPLVGNKIANPYDYFTGLTNFNGDLFASPLLGVNDEESPSRDAVRQKFLQRIKAFVVNPSHTFERKFSDRFVINWTGRIFMTLNDDPNSVGILPELNDNTVDKLMFFASKRFEGRWGERDETEARIAHELPFVARWLLDDYVPPRAVLTEGRMGVVSYFDPKIRELSQQQNYAFNLLELLALWCSSGFFWSDSPERADWCGSPSELFKELTQGDQFSALMRDWKLRSVSTALGTLARLNDTGVDFLKPDDARSFRIRKDKVLSRAEGNPAPVSMPELATAE